MTRAKDHIGAILAIIVSSFIVVGSIVVVIRTSVDLFRARKRSRKDRRGGAKRLRKMLVIGLLAADGWIALSSIGPAVSGLMGDSLSELQCDPAGFVLASALWWQYGFSLAIAVTTYVALRHPLSALKVTAERRAAEIIAVILVVGVIQATMWRCLHGFESWRSGYPFRLFRMLTCTKETFVSTVPPRRLPRSFSSSYHGKAVLVRFRSDSTDEDLKAHHFYHHRSHLRLSHRFLEPSRPDPAVPLPSIVDRSVAPPAPWEWMTFPNLSALDQKGAMSVAAVGMIAAMPICPMTPKTEESTLKPPRSAYIRDHRQPSSSDMTIVPDRPILKHDSFGFIASPPIAMVEDRHAHFQLQSDDVVEDEDLSFRAMLDSDPSVTDDDEDDHRTLAPSTRAPSPDGSRRVESMASFMNRRTSLFLLWFPLTHLVISAITSFRFAYFVVHRTEGPMIEALTLIAIMGQGVADVIVFGLVERRTHKRYKQEVASCSPGNMVQRVRWPPSRRKTTRIQIAM